MTNKLKLLHARLFSAVALGISSSLNLAAAPQDSADPALPKAAMRWSQLGVKAGTDYQGDGLAISPNTGGARLRCVFQQLEGEATREGLWLTSTVTNAVTDRFRVMAVAVGRRTGATADKPLDPSPVLREPKPSRLRAEMLPPTGSVSIDGQTARFTRPRLVEEYTVSMDGVRQDFIIEQRPADEGLLLLELAVTGAKVEPLADGARLVLPNSRRKIAYTRLRATDATGKELSAQMEGPSPPSEERVRVRVRGQALTVVVNDAEAVYPVRIDPTFSDANWISMNPSLPGANGGIGAAAVDESGNLYIAGGFTVVGAVIANNIAKWNGSSWAPLGSGLNGDVSSLAVAGNNLYAVGSFTMAGDSAANHIAKWDGSNWSALGSGMDTDVIALAVRGSDVYAGGLFTKAGGSAANYVAKWDGSSWSALGSGLNGYVSALAVSGSDLYVAGYFSMAGGIAVNHIAKWNGSNWTALGLGLNSVVWALAVSSTNVYAGGQFTMAGGHPVIYIAKWNGSNWSGLGSGVGGGAPPYNPPIVSALVVSESDLYVGGYFTTAGGKTANYVAKWNGSDWSALGSGMNSPVNALVVCGRDLFAGRVRDGGWKRR